MVLCGEKESYNYISFVHCCSSPMISYATQQRMNLFLNFYHLLKIMPHVTLYLDYIFFVKLFVFPQNF